MSGMNHQPRRAWKRSTPLIEYGGKMHHIKYSFIDKATFL